MTTDRFRRCDTPGCDRQAEPGEKLCLFCAVESWVNEGEDDKLPVDKYDPDMVIPCGHKMSDIYRDPEPLGGTSHCTKCEAQVITDVNNGKS